MRNVAAFTPKMGCNLIEGQRMVQKAWYAADKFADEVTYMIKREPLKAVGITFGFALGLGAFVGWLGSRK